MSSVSGILASYYLQELKTQEGVTGITGVQPENVIQLLSETYPNWTWEVVSERITSIETCIMDVRVYLPGRILYGRTVYNEENAGTAHYKAIQNACEALEFNNSSNKQQQVTSNFTTPTQPQQTSNQAKPIQGDIVSEQEIMDIVMNNNAKVDKKTAQPENKMIENLEQLNNDPRTEVPYDKISDKCFDQMEESMATTAATQQSQQKPVKFTKEQVDAVNKIKTDFNIINNEMFGNYVNSWDPKLSRKSDLTPANVDSFIKWANSLGEIPR